MTSATGLLTVLKGARCRRPVCCGTSWTAPCSHRAAESRSPLRNASTASSFHTRGSVEQIAFAYTKVDTLTLPPFQLEDLQWGSQRFELYFAARLQRMHWTLIWVFSYRYHIWLPN